MAEIYDTHAHYDDVRFDDDRHLLVSSLPLHGVGWVLSCADSLESCRKVQALAEAYPHVSAAFGIHPHNVHTVDWGTLEPELRRFLAHPKCVCLGEIGLDYHYDFSPRDKQRDLFARQLALANELDLPVSVHIREATADALDILRRYQPRGVVHCFSGSLETARTLLDWGMYLGFGGAVTFKGAVKPLAAAAFCPADRLLLETDAPYMTPVPYRGRRCESTHIAHTAAKIAEVRGVSVDTILDIARHNAQTLFRLPA
ncbi:MAG: TatD family hydrolase [Oscillospiraceae bacterium]|jgi:TatD DNase family protein|nr:TatD family hydrolase [Oscillospiraceae bacterium]